MPFDFFRRKTRPQQSHPISKRQLETNHPPEYDPDQPCHIDSLPDELLAKMILHLPWMERLRNTERVSKRWRRVARQSGWSDFTTLDNRQWEYSNGVQRDRVVNAL